MLSYTQRIRRLNWAKKYCHWTVSDWQKVLFSDESRFCLVPDGPVLVRRKDGEAYLPQCVAPTLKHGGGGIMVWGCFAANGVGRLYEVKGKINAEKYKKIVKFCAIPSGSVLMPGNAFIFMQDNAPVHTAGSVKAFCEEAGLKILDWPGQSPDLNPTENLRGFMKRKMRGVPCKNAQELFSKLLEVWRRLGIDYLRKLVESMPRRLRQCIRMRGRPTRY